MQFIVKETEKGRELREKFKETALTIDFKF
jgi:hypothetical protein